MKPNGTIILYTPYIKYIKAGLPADTLQVQYSTLLIYHLRSLDWISISKCPEGHLEALLRCRCTVTHSHHGVQSCKIVYTVFLDYLQITHTIHVWCITCIYYKNQPFIGKYTHRRLRLPKVPQFRDWFGVSWLQCTFKHIPHSTFRVFNLGIGLGFHGPTAPENTYYTPRFGF